MYTSARPSRRDRHRRAVALAIVAAAGLLACGADEDASGDTGGAATATVAPVRSDSPSTPPSTSSAASSSAPAPTPSSTPVPGSSFVVSSIQPVPDATVSADVPPPPPGPPSTNALAAVADLATQQGVDPATITVVGEENVTWPDSSIGCPVEGMAYMQVLTDGVRLVLELDGVRYEYHAGGSRSTPFLCPNPTPPTG